MTKYSYIDPSHAEIIDDLCQYFEMPSQIVQQLVMERQPYCYKREFIDKKLNHNRFYNMTSAFFIFGNAKHGPYKEDISKLVNKKLVELDGKRKLTFFEFGGGVGDISIAAKQAFPDIFVSYNELSVLQKDFFSFRCFRKGICDIVTIDDWFFDCSELLNFSGFDIVVALDVLEHIENYPKYLNKIISSMNDDAYLWEGSYFLENRASDPCHCIEDSFDYRKIITESGLVLQNDLRLSEGNLWKKVKK